MFHRSFRILSFSATVHRITPQRNLRYITKANSKTPVIGKTILVTGASRGIGLAIAKTYAYRGASKVVLVGRNEATLKEVTDAINEEPGAASREHAYRVGDVADREFWVDLGKEWKNVDILVNAAGVTHSSLLVATKLELLEQVVQTNLMGTMWGCQVISKVMMRQRRVASNTGCIINVSSLLGIKGGRGSTAYAASKAGVLALTRSLAAELGQSNIRVNAIVPGYVETQMTEAMTPDARARALDAIPLKRFGTAEEVADAALFLATNAYANNCTLNLDGGLSAT